MSGDSTRSPLGFLAIQVDIHRPPGDPFNCRTWSFPLIHELVEDSGEAKIVYAVRIDPECVWIYGI
jgi:hypothetical protein